MVSQMPSIATKRYSHQTSGEEELPRRMENTARNALQTTYVSVQQHSKLEEYIAVYTACTAHFFRVRMSMRQTTSTFIHAGETENLHRGPTGTSARQLLHIQHIQGATFVSKLRLRAMEPEASHGRFEFGSGEMEGGRRKVREMRRQTFTRILSIAEQHLRTRHIEHRVRHVRCRHTQN